MFGILNINKPAGITSRDVVNHVQRIVRPKKIKVGHAGTLDPLATGVLVICVGPTTRLIEYVQRSPKRYIGTFLFGKTSDTEDVEGQVDELSNPRIPSRDEIKQVLPRFVGEILQRPPAYSALKVNGKRAYALARKGDQVELKPRKILIKRLELVEFDYPRVVFDVTCGSGTYIRSLGRDVAEALGTGAVMSALERKAIGDFQLDSASEMNAITDQTIESYLLPAAKAVDSLPVVELDDAEIQRIANGMSIRREFELTADEFAGFDPSGNLVSILAPRGDQQLRPVRNFVSSGDVND